MIEPSAADGDLTRQHRDLQSPRSHISLQEPTVGSFGTPGSRSSAQVDAGAVGPVVRHELPLMHDVPQSVEYHLVVLPSSVDDLARRGTRERGADGSLMEHDRCHQYACRCSRQRHERQPQRRATSPSRATECHPHASCRCHQRGGAKLGRERSDRRRERAARRTMIEMPGERPLLGLRQNPVGGERGQKTRPLTRG